MDGLATDGYYGGGATGGDLDAPTITVVSPTVNTAPGAAGGFSLNFDTAKTTPIVLQVVDVTPGLQYVGVVARLGDGVEETVYRRSQFRGQYLAGSSSPAISNGVQLNILRLGGWPKPDDLTLGSSIIFDVDAIDQAGNITTVASFTWLLPAVGATTLTPPTSVGDHVNAALARLCEYLKAA